MKANERQVGGAHYRAHGTNQLQHWDTVVLFKLDYFQAQCWRYVLRWRHKNGIEDLEKALHYLEKYVEVIREHGWQRHSIQSTMLNFTEMATIFGLDYVQGTVIRTVFFWERLDDLITAAAMLTDYLKNAYEDEKELQEAIDEDTYGEGTEAPDPMPDKDEQREIGRALGDDEDQARLKGFADAHAPEFCCVRSKSTER